jgi:hypothetical protein
MGLLSRFFTNRTKQDQSFNELDLNKLDEYLSMCIRAMKVDLCADLNNIYSSQMENKLARTLAAQVVNFLMGEDIDGIARDSDEPLRSWIMVVLPQVRQRAAEYMQADRQTREIIVATHRMSSVVNFGKYEIAWLQSPEKMRIERLLVEYGPEFPEEITPAAYAQLFDTYHSVKSIAWKKR